MIQSETTAKSFETLFTSPRHLYRKAARDGDAFFKVHRRGDEVAMKDAFFKFVVAIHSLIDSAKASLPDDPKAVYDRLLNIEPALQACQVLATGAKYLFVSFDQAQYEKHDDLVEDAYSSVMQSPPIGSASDPTIGDTEPRSRIKLRYESGDQVRATDVVQETLPPWDKFLRDHVDP